MNENEIIEEWRPIEGYEGLYEVSNMGRIKSLKFDKEKILSQCRIKNGYLYVALCKNGKMKTYKVHRLVAQAFLENPSNLPCVNHIDENKVNNYVDNLEWCSYKYNSNHGTCQKRRVDSTDYKAFQERRVANIDWKSVAEKLSRQVYQYSLDGTLVGIWDSTAECGRQGFDQGHVSQCCNGNRKQHKGFLWSYTPL